MRSQALAGGIGKRGSKSLTTQARHALMLRFLGYQYIILAKLSELCLFYGSILI